MEVKRYSKFVLANNPEEKNVALSLRQLYTPKPLFSRRVDGEIFMVNSWDLLPIPVWEDQHYKDFAYYTKDVR
ncbi:hypothetical protein CEXT_276341 [Caerostris extrusa]|uniref:Uncharacterized protein n=1 Tax=Caerostris extrusa TaxID=172846 RepID=A0AAV4P4S4_CAEEX|nr:hypothetical protein CEXT_276341 [Caerostris extrusa]